MRARIPDPKGKKIIGGEAVAALDSNLAVVEVDDLPFESPTDVHFNAEGCRRLGQRLPEAFLELTMSDDGK